MGYGFRFDEVEIDRGTFFSDPFCSFSFFIRLLLNANRFEIKNGLVFKQLLILSVWNIEGNQIFKEGFF